MSFIAVELPRLGYRQYPKASVSSLNFDAHRSGMIVSSPGDGVPVRPSLGYAPD
jgi:hypothetical protein